MDSRLERVRRKRPAATRINRLTAICDTIRSAAQSQAAGPVPRASAVRDSLSAGMKSTRVDWSAGASPKSSPVERESPATTASTCQFNCGAQGEALLAVGQQQSEETDSPEGEGDAQRAAESSQEDAFGEELADDPEPSGPDAQPKRDFALRAAARASRRLAILAQAMLRISLPG